MYQYMFVENKKKKADLINKESINAEEGEVRIAGDPLNTVLAASRADVRYLSTLNTRRNPDLLMPGGKFLKGNLYFKGDDKAVPTASGEDKSSDKDEKENSEEVEGNLAFN